MVDETQASHTSNSRSIVAFSRRNQSKTQSFFREHRSKKNRIIVSTDRFFILHSTRMTQAINKICSIRSMRNRTYKSKSCRHINFNILRQERSVVASQTVLSLLIISQTIKKWWQINCVSLTSNINYLFSSDLVWIRKHISNDICNIFRFFCIRSIDRIYSRSSRSSYLSNSLSRERLIINTLNNIITTKTLLIQSIANSLNSNILKTALKRKQTITICILDNSSLTNSLNLSVILRNSSIIVSLLLLVISTILIVLSNILLVLR